MFLGNVVLKIAGWLTPQGSVKWGRGSVDVGTWILVDVVVDVVGTTVDSSTRNYKLFILYYVYT